MEMQMELMDHTKIKFKINIIFWAIFDNTPLFPSKLYIPFAQK